MSTIPMFPSLASPPQRHGEGREVLDRYYTPDEVAAALVRHLPDLDDPARLAPGVSVWRDGCLQRGEGWPRILEPSVGGGAWVDALRERWSGARIHGHDIDLGAEGLRRCDSCTTGDFLGVDLTKVGFVAVVGNPPYRDAEAHVRHALKHAPVVAFLLRLAFLESLQRAPLWREHPAAKVVVLSRRPSFTNGGTDSAAYGFFIWDQAHDGPTELVVMS